MIVSFDDKCHSFYDNCYECYKLNGKVWDGITKTTCCECRSKYKVVQLESIFGHQIHMRDLK